MAKTVQAEIVRSALNALIEYYRDQQKGVQLEEWEFYTLLATDLSSSIHRPSPWTWRYIQSIHSGTITPSKPFARAVEVLGRILDGTPPAIADLETVPVFAPYGILRPGSLVGVASIPCASPGCSLWFVPNTPRRRRCYRCKPIKHTRGD